MRSYPPFYDNEPIGIYKKILAGIIEFPRFFDLKAKDIIRKLLNPDLNYRLGVADVKAPTDHLEKITAFYSCLLARGPIEGVGGRG